MDFTTTPMIKVACGLSPFLSFLSEVVLLAIKMADPSIRVSVLLV